MLAPPGFTRTSVQPDHALIATDSNVTAPLPGWGGASGIILISPQMGARFTMYLSLMEPGHTAALPAPGVQRFVYVLEGEIVAGDAKVSAEGYAYFPPHHPTAFYAAASARVLIFEKPYTDLTGVTLPSFMTGTAGGVEGVPFMGDADASLKVLLPVEEAFDMAVNLFTFTPGTTLPFVETHVMEHGLMFLAGGGVYRLSDKWYPVCRGDVIWMAPYCPQWFVAAGKSPSTYIYYKDVHRDPLVME